MDALTDLPWLISVPQLLSTTITSRNKNISLMLAKFAHKLHRIGSYIQSQQMYISTYKIILNKNFPSSLRC